MPAELEGKPGCRHHELGLLEEEDAIELWNALKCRGSRRQLTKVFHTIGYHPLMLQLLAGVVEDFPLEPGNYDAWRKASPEFDPFSLEIVQVQSHILAVALKSLPAAELRTLRLAIGFRMPAPVAALIGLLVRTSAADDPAAEAIPDSLGVPGRPRAPG